MVKLLEFLPSPGIKVVVVGDGAVGKSCLLNQFCKDQFDPSYIPTIFDNMVAHLEYQGSQVAMNCWDTAGQEDYDNLRNLSYEESHVFLLTYDVTNPTSFRNIKLKWFEEVMDFSPQANCILVGTKGDLRDDIEHMKRLKDKGLECVSTEEAALMAAELRCYGAIETSAKTRRNVDQAFEMALDSCYKQEVDPVCCTIM